MASLVLSLLLGCFQLSAATVTLEFILPSPDDQNVIRFQCINDFGFPDPGARFNFRTSTSSMKNLRTDVGQNYRTYTITSEKEGFVFCTIGEESSDPVVFAGELNRGVLIRWNGLVEWNSGMEYWNGGML